jgi:hypothetical protein
MTNVCKGRQGWQQSASLFHTRVRWHLVPLSPTQDIINLVNEWGRKLIARNHHNRRCKGEWKVAVFGEVIKVLSHYGWYHTLKQPGALSLQLLTNNPSVSCECWFGTNIKRSEQNGSSISRKLVSSERSQAVPLSPSRRQRERGGIARTHSWLRH